MISKIMRNLLLPALIMMVTALSACLSVYKVEIQQGNVVTQEMIDKLKPGMTRSQVRFVLGTPLVTDAFHPDRWDYYYYLRPSKEKTSQTQRLTVTFKNDSLLSVHSEKPENHKSKVPGG
jgi:outer membrane protein assembly factor BamE